MTFLAAPLASLALAIPQSPATPVSEPIPILQRKHTRLGLRAKLLPRAGEHDRGGGEHAPGMPLPSPAREHPALHHQLASPRAEEPLKSH